MGRPAANTLTIEQRGSGFLLHGYLNGKQTRKSSKDFNKLAELRATLLADFAKQRDALAAMPSMKLTKLTYEQIADAEAAVQIADGRRLVECVVASKRVLPPVDAVTCDTAITAWVAALRARKRSERTVEKNERRVADFVEWAKVKNLVEITPLMIERYVFRPGPADFTRLTDAQVLQAWLNFCAARARRWLAVSPFELDMKDMTATARPQEPGRILTPEQCRALLAAAKAHADGLLVPYCILTTWCFLRDSEAQRISRAALKLDGATPIVEVDTRKRRTVSYRTVSIPANVLPILRTSVESWEASRRVPFSRSGWATVREKAGLLTRGKTTRGKRRPVISSVWQGDITRHTGISHFYQRTGDIKEVCRQAGNTSDVSFRHYLTLPAEGAAEKFYAIS